RATLPLTSILCAASLVAIFFVADSYALNALRVLFAIGLTFLLISSEYVVTIRANTSNRAGLIAWYTTAVGAGAIIGPLLISMIGMKESGSFLVGAGMLLIGSVALSSCLSEREGQTAQPLSSFSAFMYMPAAFLAAFVFGMADNGGLTLLPVYGALNGYDSSS